MSKGNKRPKSDKAKMKPKRAAKPSKVPVVANAGMASY